MPSRLNLNRRAEKVDLVIVWWLFYKISWHVWDCSCATSNRCCWDRHVGGLDRRVRIEFCILLNKYSMVAFCICPACCNFSPRWRWLSAVCFALSSSILEVMCFGRLIFFEVVERRQRSWEEMEWRQSRVLFALPGSFLVFSFIVVLRPGEEKKDFASWSAGDLDCQGILILHRTGIGTGPAQTPHD